MYKRRIVRWFVSWSDSWNREFHEAIEAKVQAEFRRQFPEGARDAEAMIEKMRSFYYARMTNTSTLLVAILALFVSIVALVVPLLMTAFGSSH
ncbi:hypothetical protein KTD55_34820 [Burkholderia gladioli]|uniref:hypothetical protein n=1 Tax=Burkholderia gladioli TaxID=28095 RepID=UPI001C23EC59|nr:hypothetical protein [Burkholderia gladioli]MBU9219226.1 hypothetical protein [Burkholderia gladioli]MDN7728302.1 hypothetical protein [Burkholderia gladioli]